MKKLLFVTALAVGSVALAQVPFKIGVAGFTFCKKSLDETLEIMQKVDAHYLCVKDFHLRYNSTDEQIAAFKEKCAKYGVVPYALGPLYTKDVSQLRPYFEFARRLGVKTVVGVPYDPTDEKDSWGKRKGSRKQLEVIDQLVKEFDICYAIHNHGPHSPNMYPDVAYGWELVKDLDKRIGFCMDVGWEWGSDRDPVETIRQHGDRIYDIHLKNFRATPAKPGKGGFPRNGQMMSFETVPLPRGNISYTKVFKALAEAGYTGVCALEYERDFTNNVIPIAESIGYARGVCDAIKVKAKMLPVPEGANTLTDTEKAEGYELLFNGKDLPADKFVGCKEKFARFPQKGWFVKDGCLTMRPLNGISEDGKWFPLPPEDQKLGGGGDICTVKKYRDFVFKFDFRLTEAANSGVKYFYDETLNKGTCEEYQVLDEAHPDSTKGKNGNRRVAALYDLIPANAEKVVKPLGQWNSGMIVAKGDKVEHWLNGVKVLEYVRGSEAFRAAVQASKYATWGLDASGKPQLWGEIPEGRLLIQDHSDSTVSYCNLKVKAL